MPRDDVQEHPVLTDEEDAQQRGGSSPGSFGHTDRPSGDLEPGWQPSDVGEVAEGLIKRIGGDRRPPRREDVYPYLLVRAHSPGDRGARPTWPDVPCWESPDILLIDADWTGPFAPDQLVVNPTAGRRYRVFVRVWNLGLLPAAGVHVRGWFVNPGFFGGDPTNPAYQPQPIGMTVVPQFEDRTRPGAVQVVELGSPWDVPADLTGHECLMVSVSCPLDAWDGTLDANRDRHVAQRNLTVLAGADSAKDLLLTLGQRVTKTGTLELWHGGAAVTPLLQGVLGTTKTELGPAARLRAPEVGRLRRGVPTEAGQHLLTMFLTERGWFVADSARLWTLALELGVVERGSVRPGRVKPGPVGRGTVGGGRRKGQRHPFATPLGTRRLIEKIGLERAEQVGIVLDGDPGEVLLEGLVRLWDVGGLDARDLAGSLTEGGPFAHLLRFAHTDPETRESGGYSLTVIG